jgi:hypothetical protein
VGACLFLALASCETNLESDGGTRLWGYVNLKPRQGVKLPKAKLSKAVAGSYGDRRFRDVALVDYSKVEFAVVYLEGVAAPRDATRLTLSRSRYGLRFDHRHAAVGLNGSLHVVNSDTRNHVISCPQSDFVQNLAPGEEAEIQLSTPGDHRIFLLDAVGIEAVVFVSPGLYAVANASGRWQLRNPPPGAHTLRAWHPRFPETSRAVTISKGSTRRIDLEIGVDTITD